MLEPDVTLTDLVLAAQCMAFSLLLLRRADAASMVRRLYALLFAALALASLFGGLWHGVFSDAETGLGQWIWFCVMVALAVAAAVLWFISAALFCSETWARLVRMIAPAHLVLQISVSAFVTDSFAVATVGLLPPVISMIAGNASRFRRTGSRRALYGAAGFCLAALAGLIVAFEVSLHPSWATTLATYHMVQFVAFWMIFRSVPGGAAQPR
ncbi:hypothetical protein SAMN05421757_102865 [Tropicimonas sediminicola]|uniref:Uncharacterized protein n=2 Tax=Tropicimonas sediminicola TaxID=1031541 RepID=A0A239FYD0_9RHOB|nr:hypothetical protein SAMN05421757_102865 [Tropicimonas sediminicola]